MENEITGYYVDLPEGATTIERVNGDEINLPLCEYTAATYVPETSTHYGTLEWDASVEILYVMVNGEELTVNPLIGGVHSPQRPK